MKKSKVIELSPEERATTTLEDRQAMQAVFLDYEMKSCWSLILLNKVPGKWLRGILVSLATVRFITKTRRKVARYIIAVEMEKT